PGPSRIAYRLSRIWMKTWVRRATIALPLAATALIAIRMAGDPEIRAMVAGQRDAVIAALSQRPEFAVSGIRVTGASDRLSRAIGRVVDLAPDASSLTLDVAVIQAGIAEMGGVRSARVKLGPDGVLLISVDERIPEALWRDDEGRLWLTGRNGVAIAPAGPRADHPGLPVILGEGAQSAMEEALALFRAAPDLRPRLRAFVRIGQRRWDVVLDRDLRIMLPAKEPEAALARVMALHYGEELLDRDLAAIDMRLGARPTLRLTPEAAETMRLREAASGPGTET
ncbi:MAG TPA: cell division protein FtsQ/DivIB, partial [Paracoccaceae bacterium]|nr:cell division protein FtsQ/DivIB [Paracoccaceae bacterium]